MEYLMVHSLHVFSIICINYYWDTHHGLTLALPRDKPHICSNLRSSYNIIYDIDFLEKDNYKRSNIGY